MKRFDWRIILLTVAIFIIPPLSIPSRGVLSEGITSYVYGFPFSWFTVYFQSRGGRVFLVQALSEPNHGVSISILSAALNLVIIYAVLHAIVAVFLKKRRSDPPHKKPPEEPPEDPGQETVNAGQSRESDGQ